MRTITRMALLTALLGGAGHGWAAEGSNFDPAQLPETKGTVEGYILAPRGGVEGVLLHEGPEVIVPPPLGTQLVATVHPGDAVSVRGLSARSGHLVLAGEIRDEASGKTLRSGPFGAAPAEQREVSGQIARQLYTPRGDVAGVVLADGTQVRLPPPEARRLGEMLDPGKAVYVRGDTHDSALGSLIEARAIGTSKSDAEAIAGPPPRPGWGPHRPDGPPPPPDGMAE